MRKAALLMVLTAACTRPVLYYPNPVPETASVEPAAAAVITPVAAPAPDAAAVSDADYLMSRALLMPVAGADISHVEDTFNDPRDGQRVHHAIDILAPRGTPILSADDGKILRMSTNSLGGITMYTVDTQTRLVYYYAHMERYNESMYPGRTIARGDTLGFVGTTGNAPKNLPHLHFQVMRWAADGKFWNGEPINPFAALGGVSRHHTTPNRHSQQNRLDH
ncbi:MAG TPA: M23 family metallopeptidase [Gemmatimonadaceae bacterium]|jgi:murein DD-endopeptidase MepM/ murein hydrolase activator NlpD